MKPLLFVVSLLLASVATAKPVTDHLCGLMRIEKAHKVLIKSGDIVSNTPANAYEWACDEGVCLREMWLATNGGVIVHYKQGDSGWVVRNALLCNSSFSHCEKQPLTYCK